MDATILEVIEIKLSQNRFTERYEEGVTTHYFNPFKNTIIKEGYLSTMSWFPNKLRDIKVVLSLTRAKSFALAVRANPSTVAIPL